MITLMTMQDGINDFLKKEVASKHLLKAVDRSGNESFKNPEIIRSGWVLPKSIDEEKADEEAFPYIVTRIEKVEHVKGSRESIVTLMILYGVYGPGTYEDNGRPINDGSGYRDFWNLVETTRIAILRRNIIDKKYKVIDDFFEASMLNEQEYPYWEGYCKFKFHVVFPVPQDDADYIRKGNDF